MHERQDRMALDVDEAGTDDHPLCIDNTGGILFWITIGWQDVGALAPMVGTTARLRFEISRAKLYSFEM